MPAPLRFYPPRQTSGCCEQCAYGRGPHRNDCPERSKQSVGKPKSGLATTEEIQASAWKQR